MTSAYLERVDSDKGELTLRVIPGQTMAGYFYPSKGQIESAARYSICTNCRAKGDRRSELTVDSHTQFTAIAICEILSDATSEGRSEEASCVKQAT